MNRLQKLIETYSKHSNHWTTYQKVIQDLHVLVDTDPQVYVVVLEPGNLVQSVCGSVDRAIEVADGIARDRWDTFAHDDCVWRETGGYEKLRVTSGKVVS